MATYTSATVGATVRERAEAVLARYPSSLDRVELLTRICRDEGIELFDADLRDIRGVLRHEERGWRIYLSRQDAPQRRVFTLAHLLGHFFLHAATDETFVESPFAAGTWSATVR
jgi:Zn-dependent peptidase ImmA (M78 family)